MPKVPRVVLVCPECHQEFSLPPSIARQNRKYCSDECRFKSTRITLECAHCHKTFTSSASHKTTKRYCSKACHNAGLQRVVTLLCQQCQQPFECKASHAKSRQFCSRHCRSAARKNRVVLICQYCKASFERPASAQHLQFCSTECAGLAKTQPGTPFEKAARAQRKRHAALKEAPLNDLTDAQWNEIKAAYGHRCVYCGRKMKALTKDHLTPISQGGSHTRSNVVPACKSCNSKKYTGAPLIPIQPLLLTIAPSTPRKRSKPKIS